MWFFNFETILDCRLHRLSFVTGIPMQPIMTGIPLWRICSKSEQLLKVSERCEVPAYLMQPAKIYAMSAESKKTGTIAKFMSDVYTVSRQTGLVLRSYPETA